MIEKLSLTETCFLSQGFVSTKAGLPKVLNGIGSTILSTSEGLLTDKARQRTLVVRLSLMFGKNQRYKKLVKRTKQK